ncbi:hypothetical protein [Intestinibacter sp.]|uniref:hypothetical protein n=1 Tax=Intestinibacter sp. TaxID=1965304 RepID=UPI0025F1A1BA|nr:hypothetical protein [uncultured Intestinibacter sp.]
MIKISIENIEGIKHCHQDYIRENVETKLRIYNIFDETDNEIISFISNQIKPQLYKLTLEEIDMNMLEIINDKYRNLENKSINDYIDNDDIESLIENLEGYKEYINTTNGRTESVQKERAERLSSILSKQNNFLKKDFKEEDCFGCKLEFNKKSDLLGHINKLIKFLKKINQQGEINEKGKTIKERFNLKKILMDIFDYDSFTKNKGEWNRHKLLYRLNINVCPYCNRVPITNYVNLDGREKTTGDLDHFYCQNKYPFLGLSLYNFIPSCPYCNSRYKLQKDFLEERHIYPYKESFGDNAKFKTDFNDDYDLSYLNGNSTNFNLNIEIKTQDSDELAKLNNSIKTFRLKELYSKEKEYIRDIIKKCNYYNSKEIDMLYKFENLFDSKEEIREMVFGHCFKEDDFHKRPFSKLTKDIYDEFSVLNDLSAK